MTSLLFAPGINSAQSWQSRLFQILQNRDGYQEKGGRPPFP